MKLKLDESVSSVQDLKSLVLEVREYARWFAHNSIKKRVKAGRLTDKPELTAAASALIRDWSAQQQISQKGLDDLITTLEDYITTAPQITITLAAPPGSSLKKTLVGWFRQNVAPNVLVTFQFNSSLLGGMTVRYGSRVFDWSFRRQILEARGRFPEVLRSV